MENKRKFPRKESIWPLFLDTGEDQKQIGYIKDISEKGVKLFFIHQDKIEYDKYTFTIKLKKTHSELPELTITGLKRWSEVSEEEIFVGLELQDLEDEKSKAFQNFMEMATDFYVEAVLLEKQ